MPRFASFHDFTCAAASVDTGEISNPIATDATPIIKQILLINGFLCIVHLSLLSEHIIYLN